MSKKRQKIIFCDAMLLRRSFPGVRVLFFVLETNIFGSSGDDV